MLNKRITSAVIAALAAGLILAGCTQAGAGNSDDPASSGGQQLDEITAAVAASATADRPAPFDGEVNIAVVRQLNAGDVYENWIAGVQAEADKLDVKLTIYNADGDNAKQAQQLEQAVASKPDGILIGWGFYDSLKPGIAKAQAAGIPVTAYYVNTLPQDGLVTIDQGDQGMMTSILEAAKSDIGDQAEVIYVYVAGYQALDLRNISMEAFLKENPGIKVVATIGVVNESTAAQVADQAKAALTANPDVKAIIAPYDEFAKGATTAVNQLGLQDSVGVYGMDISTADIAVMVADGSPWKVTATTDQSNVGATALRMLALQIAGQLEGNHMAIPPVLITQDDLRAKGVTDVGQIGDAFPELSTPDLLAAPWMK